MSHEIPTPRAPLTVDAHQHFWSYTPADFGWISDDMAAIRRDFTPTDLAPLLQQSGIDRTVAVQARQSIEETTWLLSLAAENDWIAGVVGWLPLADANIQPLLDEASANPKLKGLRHILQAEPDAFMLRDDFNAGISLLRRYGLTYDVLVLEHQLPAAIEFVDRHPSQPFVLDHLAKPLIAAAALEPWRSNLIELARRPHVSCKLSGLVTEADFRAWSPADLRPYMETALEAFGPQRLLFGSDWPVCTVAATYTRWLQVVNEFIARLSPHEQQAILGGNAASFYKLN